MMMMMRTGRTQQLSGMMEPGRVLFCIRKGGFLRWCNDGSGANEETELLVWCALISWCGKWPMSLHIKVHFEVMIKICHNFVFLYILAASIEEKKISNLFLGAGNDLCHCISRYIFEVMIKICHNFVFLFILAASIEKKKISNWHKWRHFAWKRWNSEAYTVKPCPKAHMDMILVEVFLKNIHLIPQDSTMTSSMI